MTYEPITPKEKVDAIYDIIRRDGPLSVGMVYNHVWDKGIYSRGVMHPIRGALQTLARAGKISIDAGSIVEANKI